jgi:hypothetical protein
MNSKPNGSIGFAILRNTLASEARRPAAPRGEKERVWVKLCWPHFSGTNPSQDPVAEWCIVQETSEIIQKVADEGFSFVAMTASGVRRNVTIGN